jgi:hypothetical protein
MSASGGLRPLKMRQDDLILMMANDATYPIGFGDPVILNGTGLALSGQQTVPTVVRASAGAGNAIFGVCAGVDQTSLENSSNFSISRGNYAPNAVNMYIWVYPCKIDDSFLLAPNAACALSSVGDVANLATITNCNTTTNGWSNVLLDQASLQSSSNTNYQLRVMGYDLSNPTKTYGTDLTNMIVRINNIQAVNAYAGI